MPPTLAIASIAKLPPMNMAPPLRARANNMTKRAKRAAHIAVSLVSPIIIRLVAASFPKPRNFHRGQ